MTPINSPRIIVLDIEGIIFIVGLNYDTVSKLISKKYEEIKVKGEEYIKKFIQTSVTIPTWNEEKYMELIENIGNKKEYSEYYDDLKILFTKNMLSQLKQKNPRELKRFINHFLFSCSHLDAKTIETKKDILSYLIFRNKWRTIYYLCSNPNFRSLLKDQSATSLAERRSEIEKDLSSNNSEVEFMGGVGKLILDLDSNFWNFIAENSNFLRQTWDLLATLPDYSTEIPSNEDTKQFFDLLSNQRISEFNWKWKNSNFQYLNLEDSFLEN